MIKKWPRLEVALCTEHAHKSRADRRDKKDATKANPEQQAVLGRLPIILLTPSVMEVFLRHQPLPVQTHLASLDFKGKRGQLAYLLDAQGEPTAVVFGLGETPDMWSLGVLPTGLTRRYDYTVTPEYLKAGTCAEIAKGFRGVVGDIPHHGGDADAKDDVPPDSDREAVKQICAYVWALGAYAFNDLKSKDVDLMSLPRTTTDTPPGDKGSGDGVQRDAVSCLVVDDAVYDAVKPLIEATYWVRDMINMPPNIMTPQALAEEAMRLSEGDAVVDVISGEDLVECHYPGIYAVGQASDHPPKVIDIHWGKSDHPKVVLVGKGVTFDTGGLNLKSGSGMALMKKDMGGAAHALGLASMIQAAGLPLNLRVLIGAVENAVSHRAYRPSDVIKTRKGCTIEIGNTDAEGRVVLADLLDEASREKPNLIIDFATLTGAARVALGTDVPAMFTNDDDLARTLQDLSLSLGDPVWHMPLWQPYRSQLHSDVADLATIGKQSGGEAILAALFLETFVDPSVPWLHIDLMAWNKVSTPGKPKGGEAMTLRLLLAYLRQRYGRYQARK